MNMKTCREELPSVNSNSSFELYSRAAYVEISNFLKMGMAFVYECKGHK